MNETTGPVNLNLIRRLVATWPRRATIRSDKFPVVQSAHYDPLRPDYPLRLVPFRDHVLFQVASPEQVQQVLTWAWVVYNERTILAEEYMANPAFTMIAHGVFEGAGDIQVRQAVQHALIDEHFHTLIHINAIDETLQRRGLVGISGAPDSVTRRGLLTHLARAVEPWEKALVTLAFAVVAEISVNAYLNLLSEDNEIQPMHRLVTTLHARDEFAHGQMVVELVKLIFVRMSELQQRFFVAMLPEALRAYASHDYTAWRTILNQAGVPNADEIVSDCERDSSSGPLVRDFSGLRQVAEELEIMDRIDFEFAK